MDQLEKPLPSQRCLGIKIDVHILHRPNEVDVISSTLNDHPINQFHIDGIKGNILQSRINGFKLGSAQYVSFVDPDDEILDNAFQKCADVLDSNPNIGTVYTNSYYGPNKPVFNHKEWSLEWHKKASSLAIHQLVVTRRDVMEQAINELPDLPEAKMFPEQLIYGHVAKIAPIKFLSDFFGYRWNRSSTGAARSSTKEEKAKVRKYVSELLHGNNIH